MLDEILEKRLGTSPSSHRHLKNIQNYHPRYLNIKVKDQQKKVLNFASNDYLALSCSNNTLQNIESQPSSRLLGGNLSKTESIEKTLANWLGKESSLLFPSGYMANNGILASLPQKGDLIIMDKLCHASLIDGARLSKADLKRYRHLDLDHLETILSENTGKICWVVTESIFSMDGDYPNVKKLIALKKKYSFQLIVDEAHGIGIYDTLGRGLFAEKSAIDEVDIFIFNLSKAFALQGGVIAGSKLLKKYLVNTCRSFIYTTATPYSHISSVPARCLEIKRAHHQREHLHNLIKLCQEELNLQKTYTAPILNYPSGAGDQALRLAEHLFQENIYCPAILPPTVPNGQARLRISLNSAHQPEDIQSLAKAIKNYET